MQRHFLAYSGFFLALILIGVYGSLLWYHAHDFFTESPLAQTQTYTASSTYVYYDASSSFPIDAPHQYISVCDDTTHLATTTDERFCGEQPLLNRSRLFQVDLTHNTILFFEQGMLRHTFPIVYQAPYGKWFQTPTGYFTFGVKREKFMSSIFPVWMEHAVQLYEDFFIHAIPYYSDGTLVSSRFSGGCLRLQDHVATDFYQTAQKGDEAVVYLSLDDAVIRAGFASPVDTQEFWIRQRFNSPLKTDWHWYEDKQYNYIQHAGVDFAPRPGADDLSVFALATGTVVEIVHNGSGDAGLGNTIIIQSLFNGETQYVLYGHLSVISDTLQVGSSVMTGDALGVVGNTGYGCQYWYIGKDGCDVSDADPDIHLHLEIKTKPTLTAPVPDTCIIPSGKETLCVGYTSHNPTQFGYRDPIPLIFSSGVLGTTPEE